jgi:hypothetical protein
MASKASPKASRASLKSRHEVMRGRVTSPPSVIPAKAGIHSEVVLSRE